MSTQAPTENPNDGLLPLDQKDYYYAMYITSIIASILLISSGLTFFIGNRNVLTKIKNPGSSNFVKIAIYPIMSILLIFVPLVIMGMGTYLLYLTNTEDSKFNDDTNIRKLWYLLNGTYGLPFALILVILTIIVLPVGLVLASGGDGGGGGGGGLSIMESGGGGIGGKGNKSNNDKSYLLYSKMKNKNWNILILIGAFLYGVSVYISMVKYFDDTTDFF